MNKVTHLYTAQYSITLSGHVLPQVFVRLQEQTSTFRPRVEKQDDEYIKKYKNFVVTSSKSGKLTTSLYSTFLTKCIKFYVGKKKFLFLIDAWGGQTRLEMYEGIFQDNEERPTYTVKIIPPKFTPLVQPCDVYFYRQVKNFIKKIQNCSQLIEENREINSREDSIKIRSIVHHQLASPIFSEMIKYAWYASELSEH